LESIPTCVAFVATWNQSLFTGGAYTKKVILITILIHAHKMAMQLAWLA